MSIDKLLEAIGGIDDDLVEAAETYTPQKVPGWKPIAALAACLALMVGLGTMLFGKIPTPTSPEYATGRRVFSYIGGTDPYGAQQNEQGEADQTKLFDIYRAAETDTVECSRVLLANGLRAVFDEWARQNGQHDLLLVSFRFSLPEESDGRQNKDRMLYITVSAEQYGRLDAYLKTEEGRLLTQTLEMTMHGYFGEFSEFHLEILELTDHYDWLTPGMTAPSKDAPGVYIQRQNGKLVTVDPNTHKEESSTPVHPAYPNPPSAD